jgi:hypothetical protein
LHAVSITGLRRQGQSVAPNAIPRWQTSGPPSRSIPGMGFFKRLLGAGSPETPASVPVDASTIEAEERQHELEVLRGEQERLDELAQRQLRYAQYAWQPPAQGGERRADDGDRSAPG